MLPPCATSGRLHRRPHRCYGRGGSAAGRIHPCAAASRESASSARLGGAALCLCNSSRPDRSRCEDRIAHPRRHLHPRVVKPRDARRWGLRTRREGTPARCRKSSPLGRRGFPRFHDASTAPFGTCPPAAAMAEIPRPKRPPEDAPGRTRTCDPLLRRQPLFPAELRGRTARIGRQPVPVRLVLYVARLGRTPNSARSEAKIRRAVCAGSGVSQTARLRSSHAL